MSYPIVQLVQEFLINGYAVFEDFISLQKVDELQAVLTPMLENVRAHDSRILAGDLATGRGRVTEPLRYKVDTPWTMPFSDPSLYEHPDVLAVLVRLWDSDDFVLSDYISYHPCPGCDALNWHRDGELFAPNIVLPVFPAMTLKIALVDTNEENGSFELLPSTHHNGLPELTHTPGSGHGAALNELIETGRYPSKMRLNLRRGSAFICDARLIHRGTPNRSDHARTELDIGYTCSWYDPRNEPIELTRQAFEALSERGRKLLRKCRIIEAT
jgi:ectoine hydroxylase-related dioxygenase (phytanoyl-CoA dioxygenase family)